MIIWLIDFLYLVWFKYDVSFFNIIKNCKVFMLLIVWILIFNFLDVYYI